MMKKNNFAFLLIVASLLAFSTFTWYRYQAIHKYDPDIRATLKIAGSNRSELEKVLEHYRKSDQFKYKAAEFLITNMIFHASTKQSLISEKGEEIPFDAMVYPTQEAVTAAVDSLKSRYRVSRVEQYDCRTISADYLVNHIDWCMNVWEQSPWKNQTDFNMFCQYILPYRAQNEPLSQWQTAMRQRYLPVIDATTSSSLVAACRAVNEQLGKDIRYDNRWVYGLGLRPVTDLFTSTSGMCDDLTSYGACAMRSVGIPVAVDFTLWAHMNVGHSWCVMFDEMGQPHSFGPGEQQPGDHKAVFSRKKMAKVYRQHFAVQKESLAWINQGKEELPPFFRNYTISDVTREYIQTVDVQIPVLEQATKYLYLCIFNFDWRPYAWSEVVNGQALFTDMGPDVIFLPARYGAGSIIPVSGPFILQENGQIKMVEYDGGGVVEIEITGWLSGIGQMENGQRYTLHCWNNNEWKYHSSSVVKNQKLVFGNVLSGRLYKLQNPSRCFLVDGDKIKWY